MLDEKQEKENKLPRQRYSIACLKELPEKFVQLSIFKKIAYSLMIIFIISFLMTIVMAVSAHLNAKNAFKSPDLLTPGDVLYYIEVESLAEGINTFIQWNLWDKEIRESKHEAWNYLQHITAGLLSEEIQGLTAKLPMSWISATKKAAFSVDKTKSWCLLLNVYDPDFLVVELMREPGIKIIKSYDLPYRMLQIEGAYKKQDIYVKAYNSWLVITNSNNYLEFIQNSHSKPETSIKGTMLELSKQKNTLLKGVISPKYYLEKYASSSPATKQLTGLLAENARITFWGQLDPQGKLDLNVQAQHMIIKPHENVFWKFIKNVFYYVCALIFLIVLGILTYILVNYLWLKYNAKQKGIVNAQKPIHIDPSDAFRNDLKALKDINIEKLEQQEDKSEEK